MNFNLDRWDDHADETRTAVERVLKRQNFIFGEEVEAFESEMATYLDCDHFISVGSGTDAMRLTLQALGVGPGDEVISPAHDAAYAGLAIAMVGARPTFCDVDPVTWLIHPESLEEQITPQTRAVIPVHLYGRACDMTAINTVAAKHRIHVIEDACQAHGLKIGDAHAGTYGRAGCFSFYPTKNLGCCGDGGGIATDDENLAQRLKMLRNGGRSDRYTHLELGTNSGLDEIQAAILRSRLPYLDSRNAARREAAERYGAIMSAEHVFHLCVARHPMRDHILSHLKGLGLPSFSHYPLAASSQPAFQRWSQGYFPMAEQIAAEVFSFPLYPGIPQRDQFMFMEALQEFLPYHPLTFQG